MIGWLVGRECLLDAVPSLSASFSTSAPFLTVVLISSYDLCPSLNFSFSFVTS